MTADELMKQASMTSHDYALKAMHDLSGLLGLDMKRLSNSELLEKLAPFAPVWAAMISAAAQDFDTSISNGLCNEAPSKRRRSRIRA